MSLKNFNRQIKPDSETSNIQQLFMSTYKEWFEYNYNFAQLCIAASINSSSNIIISNDEYNAKGKEIKFEIMFGNEFDRLVLLLYFSYEYYKINKIKPEELALTHYITAQNMAERMDKQENAKALTTIYSKSTANLLLDILSILPQNDKNNYVQGEVSSSSDWINNEFHQRLQQALNDNNMNGEIINVIEGPRLEIIEYKLTTSQTITKADWDKIKLSLGKERLYWDAANDGRANIILIEREREFFKPIKFSELNKVNNLNYTLPIYIGLDKYGIEFCFDLKECPHLLVAGTTGGGKSEAMKAILSSLLGNQNIDEIYILDPKRVDYTKFKNHKQVILVTENDAFLDCLKDIVVEMERRYKLLESSNANGINEYNRQGGNLKYKVLLVDELADLILMNKKKNEISAEDLLILLAQKSRAAGIHIILSTQRPDADTFKGLLRSNIDSRIACRVQKSTESRIILDEVGAEELLGNGDMYIKIKGRDKVRVQGALVEM